MERQVKNFKIKETFDINDVPDNLTTKGYSETSDFVPPIDQSYVFRKDLLSDILAWHTFGSSTEGFYMTGPTGSGKTTLPMQVSARLNIPIVSINAHSRLETPELVGQYSLVKGEMKFIDGPLTMALRKGYWFLLNEIDLLDPATAAGLNEIAEGRPLVIPENDSEIVHPAEGFAFLVTGNTAGGGDDKGVYQGTIRQNMAFIDRFWMTYVDYPDEELELNIIQKAVPNLSEDILKTMVSFAGNIRSLFMDEELDVTMSTRTLIRWARMTDFFRPLKNKGVNPIYHALDRALCFRTSKDGQASIHEVAQRLFGI